MSINKKFNFERLQKYCSENNVTLLEDYSNVPLKGTVIIKGKCVSEKCNNNFEKNFNYLIKSNSFCIDCANNIKNEKSKKTNLEKYGCEHSSQNEDIKNKMIENSLKKYGCKNVFQNEEVKNKIKFNNLIKYGVEYNTQLESNKEQYKKTCLEKYGYENPSQNEEIKKKKIETSLKNWGVENPTQNSDIMEKSIKQNYKLKEYTFPSNKIIEIQGYENLALNELIINEKIDESDIITGCKNVPVIWYNDEIGKKHRHYVDIFIPSQNRCIEVKSTWTYEKQINIVLLKQSAAKELGYKYEIWVYNNKKVKVKCYD